MQLSHIIGAIVLLLGGAFIGNRIQSWQCSRHSEPTQRCVLRTAMRKL